MRLVPSVVLAALLATASLASAEVCYRLDPFGVTFQFATVPAGNTVLLSGFDRAVPERSAFGTSRTIAAGQRVAFSVLDDGLARNITALLTGNGQGAFTSNDGLRGTMATVACADTASPNPGTRPVPCQGWLCGFVKDARAAGDEPPAQFTTGLTSAGAVFDAVGTKVGDVLGFDGAGPVVMFDSAGTRFSVAVASGRLFGTFSQLFFEQPGCVGDPLYPAEVASLDVVSRTVVAGGLVAYIPDAAGVPVTVTIRSRLDTDVNQDTGGLCVDDGAGSLSRSVVPTRSIDLGTLFVLPFSAR